MLLSCPLLENLFMLLVLKLGLEFNGHHLTQSLSSRIRLLVLVLVHVKAHIRYTPYFTAGVILSHIIQMMTQLELSRHLEHAHFLHSTSLGQRYIISPDLEFKMNFISN